MRYYFTDFYYWEQPLIDQLRKEGKYVYSVIDTGGVHYMIVYKGWVNRYGFLITDEDILADCDDNEMDDITFDSLNGIEDGSLRETKKDMTEILRKSKEDYESRNR